jgi:hypothetical protein
VKEVIVLGANSQALVRLGPLEIIGILTMTQYKQEDSLKTLMPDVIVSGEASYHDRFFRDKLEAKFGVRSRFFNRQNAMKFDPQTLSYFQYSDYIIGRSTTVDLFMILKIGDAQISLSLNNIMNVPYILSPIYPMPPRYLRLSVNWVFID